MKSTVGQRIKQRRKELNITQAEIEKNMNIKIRHLSDIETGKYLPSATTLVALSNVLDCSIEWILTGKYPCAADKDMKLPVAQTDEEIYLLNSFREMNSEDQEELLAIVKIKSEKRKKEGSYHLDNEQEKIS